MHTVDLLEEAIALATRSGIRVRQDWFGGSTAGACEFNGKKWIFIDLSLSLREQLEQVLGGLRELAEYAGPAPSHGLQSLLNSRKAA